MSQIDAKAELFDENTENCGLPLTALLRCLSLERIANEIEKQYYKPHHFHYPVVLLLKLLIIMRYRKLSFRKVMFSLTEDDLENILTTEQIKAGLQLPSGKTLHHFVCYRLGETGIEWLMKELGKELTHLLNHRHIEDEGMTLIVDSTPLEASRYSKVSPYNVYYEIHMDKLHITMADGYPVCCMFSDGLANDAPYGRDLMKMAAEFNPKVADVLADGGYDNVLMYADIYANFGIIPAIRMRENSVFNPDGSRMNIKKTVNKLWKRGGDMKKPVEEQITYLYSLQTRGKEKPEKFKELAGAYLRNQAFINYDNVLSRLNERGLCERRHAQFKNVMKFNVKGYREESRKLYIFLDFIAIQCMFLTYLQNHSQNTNLAGYV